MIFRSSYKIGFRPKGLSCGPSLTQQHFANEADINTIMSKYNRTGFLVDPLVPRTRQPLFGDFGAMPDFKGIQDQLALAKEKFMSLPAALRKRFNNNAALLLDFLQDPQNLEEAIRLGLVERPAEAISPDPEVKDVAISKDGE